MSNRGANKGSRVIEILLRPDILFTIATFQGLTPYVFWPMGVGRGLNSNNLNYLPVVIILSGWLSFLAGCALTWRRISPEPRFAFASREGRIRKLVWFLLIAGFVQCVLVVRVYGALPILSYLRNDNEIDVVTATVMQQGSAVGQIALLALTITVLAGVLLELVLVAIEKRKRVPLLFYVALLLDVAMTLINGKRIGMVRIVFLLGGGLLLYSRRPLSNVAYIIPLVKRRSSALLAMGLCLFGIYSMAGPIASLRNQGRVEQSSSGEVISYQEGPILNMEEQTSKAGLGPGKLNLTLPLVQLIPIKLLPQDFGDSYPPREDPSSPSGFYELIQWGWGLPGVLLFPAFIGAVCMWLYQNSRRDARYFLCYCQVTLSLLIAHSFNEFLIAPLVLVPCLCLWMIGKWTSTKSPVKISVGV
jgi:oligosaccharide repeat unit polymerase